MRSVGNRSLFVARELGAHEGTLGNWVGQSRANQKTGAMTNDDPAELCGSEKERGAVYKRYVLERFLVGLDDHAAAEAVFVRTKTCRNERTVSSMRIFS